MENDQTFLLAFKNRVFSCRVVSYACFNLNKIPMSKSGQNIITIHDNGLLVYFSVLFYYSGINGRSM